MIEAKSVDMNEARTMVEAMIEFSTVTKPGLPMAFAVVDSAGVMVYFARQDGAAKGPRIMAENKAYTVIHCKGLGDSGEVGKFVKRDFVFDLSCFVEDGRLAPVEGGLPIKDSDGTIIGGIAASGREGYEDVEVAKAGLKAFAEMRKK